MIELVASVVAHVSFLLARALGETNECSGSKGSWDIS